MRAQKQTQSDRRYGWRQAKQDLSALGGLLTLLAILFGAAVLPGLLTDSASTIEPRIARAAKQ